MKKHVIAVIGCGRIANGAHFPGLMKLENVRVKYACDIIEEKAKAAVEKYSNVETAITDYKVALADPEVEAVFVLTPNFAHYTVTMDALRAGKHVFCEKPITVNYELSVEMAEEAKKQNKLLVIGVCNRFHRSVEKIKEMNDAGKLGKIYHVVCNFRARRSIPGLGGDFTTKSQSGGGVLIDWGVHYLDLILYILGSPKIKTVTCDAYNEMAKDLKSYKYEKMWAGDTADIENGTNDVDDCVSGYVRTDTGVSISFNGSWAQNIPDEDKYIDFLGDKGGVRLNYFSNFKFFDGATLETEIPEFDIPSAHHEEDADFIRCLETGEKNRCYIDNILETMKLLSALYESSEKKEEIRF